MTQLASEDGYTLIETLVALFMISLAMAGLGLGIQVVGGAQLRISNSLASSFAIRSGQAILERTLQPLGAFRAQEAGQFNGQADQFNFLCGKPEPCQARISKDAKGALLEIDHPSRTLHLRREDELRFVYQGETQTYGSWPPPSFERQPLRAVAIVDSKNEPVLIAKLWSEQPGKCEFDVVMQDCR